VSLRSRVIGTRAPGESHDVLKHRLRRKRAKQAARKKAEKAKAAKKRRR